MRAIATVIYATAVDTNGANYGTPPDFADVPLSDVTSDLNSLVSLAGGNLTMQKSGQFIISGVAAYSRSDA